MPFESEAQRRFLWMKEPEIARRWAHEYPKQKNLPYHKKDKEDTDNTILENQETKEAKEKKEKGLFALPTYENGGKRTDGLEAFKSTDKYTRNNSSVDFSSSLKTKSASEEGEGEESHSPPNYRQADLTGSRCSVCANYDHTASVCNRYQTPVDKNAVCDSFTDIHVGSDKMVTPMKPMGVGAPSPAGSSDLSTSQAFKLGFLYRCAEEGLTQEEIFKRVEGLLSMTKQSAGFLDNPLGNLASVARTVGGPIVGTGKDLALIGLIGGPIAAGGIGGSIAANLSKGDASPETLKSNELAEEYERLTEEARRKKQLRDEAEQGGLIRIS